MILLLIDLDGCLMTLSFFQEKYGIYLHDEEQGESYRGVDQGARNMEYGFLLIQSAEWIRRSLILGILYSKHSRKKNF